MLEINCLTSAQHGGTQILIIIIFFSWESGKPDLRSKHLPGDKQYLVTKGVPCSKRIKQLQSQESKEREVEDGWIETDNPSSTATGGVKPQTMDIDDIGEVVDIDDE